MYSIIVCMALYLMILFMLIRFQVNGGNAFEYGTNLIFVSKNLLNPKSKMHKLFRTPNTLWNQHIKQNAIIRLVSIVIFPFSLIFSMVALILLLTNNNLYFVFDCISFVFQGINLLTILVLIIWICIDGVNCDKLLNKISDNEYQNFKEKILKDYPNFYTENK